MDFTKETYQVNGLSCQGCADTVSKALNKLEGVRSSNVSLENENAEIEYDGDQVDINTLKKAVKDAGYELNSLR